EAVSAALERAAALTGAGSTIGCSAPGVIGDGRGVESGSAVSVWCGVLPGARIRTFSLEAMPSERGMAVVGMPTLPPAGAIGLLLADPWSFPVDGFVEQSNDALPDVHLVGGI